MVDQLRRRARVSCLVWLPAVLPSAGCSEAPPEILPTAVQSERSLEPLKWSVPPTWPEAESSPSAARRAGYRVPRAGDDNEDAELLVLFFGTGAAGDRDKQWDAWFQQFDGDAKGKAARKTLTVRGMSVEIFEFMGNYKLNVGKQSKGQTKSPVQMVKKNFRMIGAVIRTENRGNWFVRLVGPDETVLAAKEPFLQMLQGVE